MENLKYGIKFLRPPAGLQLMDKDSYLNCLKLVKKLLEKPDFVNSTPLFYINCRTNEDYKNSVRLAYFTNDEIKNENTIQHFLDSNNKDIISPHFEETVEPSHSVKPEYVKSCEVLYWLTRIGLDLLDYNDFLQIQTKMVKYRQSYASANIPGKDGFSKSSFESIFSEHSAFFKGMDSLDIERLWKELDWEPRTNHHLVNMLLLG